MNIPSPYTLPTIDFVGGSTQDFIFRCYFYLNKKPYDLSSCTANFSIVNFVNKQGEPLISKPMRVGADSGADGESSNLVRVALDPADTVNLPAGKYIYQISIRDVSGDIEIPGQGILFIVNNIDKSFAR